ncbi:Putative lumazine-binding protein [Pseudomonas sp. 22 E 5]|uniref:Putative lumazine-binding n=1 Tax=Pseudomonas salomonii TaxID=191391 RepID=A0A1H3QU08_9PSED|nr:MULTISPECIES: nuclear transport factor 2 family protein [Pseudomonas]CRM18606.1 Putative lumazine-binding protein [Pseudomonas sp. 58 R 3]CRM71335.1 Putative lumazine-binding protein [Pseudomonas sp. 22 E 5]SDZ16886.1 Putative lumazine-binding [Pseudomonas salomonii]
MIDEIQAFLNDYFSVLQTQDLNTFDQVFHRGCVLYSAQNSAVVVRPFDEYRAMVQGRKSPQEGGFPQLDEVLMIDVMSPEMAIVKVRLRLFNNVMVDYLNLMKVEGRWMIFAKLFHKAGEVADQ